MINKGKTKGGAGSHVGKSSDKRAGKRRDRNKRVGARVPELGYYLIVTDTEETEKNYFEGLRNSIPVELKDRLVIKVEKAKTVELVKKALELTGQKYSKNDRNIYHKLMQYGDEERAIRLAERYYRKCVEDGKKKPSEMWPASKVQLLVREIKEKVRKFNDNVGLKVFEQEGRS